MPQFAFRATDRMGNAVEGNVAAEDKLAAVEQVVQMGYVPRDVQPASAPPAEVGVEAISSLPVSAGAEAGPSAPYAAPVSAGHPPLVDLSRPAEELAAVTSGAATRGETTVEMAGAPARTERIEPWQRGGPVPQAPVPPAGGYASGSPLSQTQPIPTMGGAAALPGRPEVARGPERPNRGDIPYGGSVQRPKTLPKRFMEVMIYPIYAGVVVKDLAPFYRQFATLIGAGLPLYQALVGLEGNTNNAKLKEVARAGQAQVQAGGRFSDVLASYPWIFPPMQIELVRAAEQGGMLEQVLKQIAEYIEHELDIRRKISVETFYPKFVLFVALMLLGRGGFSGGQMAIVGLVLGGMGKAEYTFGSYLWDTIGFLGEILLPFLILVAVFRLSLFNIPGVRELYDTFKMRIPGLGKLIRMFAVAKFMRTYAALYKAGFAMGTALEIAGDACGNAVIRKTARNAIREAERGGRVSEALSKSGIFPHMALDMFRTGETTGNLDQMLNSIGDYYESEGKMKSHQLAIFFGVFVFLCVAILIGMNVISFYQGYGASVAGAGGG